MTVEEHRDRARRSVRTVVLTVSDTRTPETDRSGRRIREMLEEAGHRVAAYEIVPDEPNRIREKLLSWIGPSPVEAVLITGGTGLAPRDSTCEVVESLLEKRIDGFGELFRSLSFREIGPAAMLSRAIAGVASGTLLVAMPGSPEAVRLAMGRLILPELCHMVWLLGGESAFDRRGSEPPSRPRHC